MNDNKKNIIDVLSPKLKIIIERLTEKEFNRINEIRLRVNKPLSVSINNKSYFISLEGVIQSNYSNTYIVTQEDVDITLRAACQYSLHSYQKELSEGFITLNGGNRMGICGTCVVKENTVETVKNIYALNIRVAKEIIGCCDDVYNSCFRNGIKNTLIVGPPSSGKTTILRDLCRIIGNENSISIIDERNELAATYNGNPQNDVGICSDVFNGYPRNCGIMIALKTMSPKVIVCDEIGTYEDVTAIKSVLNCGVNIITTAHCGSISEVTKRDCLKSLFEEKVFDNIVLLGTENLLGKVIDIKRMDKQYA